MSCFNRVSGIRSQCVPSCSCVAKPDLSLTSSQLFGSSSWSKLGCLLLQSQIFFVFATPNTSAFFPFTDYMKHGGNLTMMGDRRGNRHNFNVAKSASLHRRRYVVMSSSVNNICRKCQDPFTPFFAVSVTIPWSFRTRALRLLKMLFFMGMQLFKIPLWCQGFQSELCRLILRLPTHPRGKLPECRLD